MKLFLSLHRNIQIRVVSTFLARVVGGMIFPFMTIYFADRLGAKLTGILILFNVILGVFMSFYGGYIADTIGRKRAMVIGQFLTAVSFGFMTLANSPWWDSVWLTFFMFVINNLAGGLMGPAGDAMLIDVSTPDTRSFIYSVNYWSINAGFVVASAIGPFLYKSHRFGLYVALTAVSIFNLFLIVKYVIETYVPIKRNEEIHILRDVFNKYKIVFFDKAYMYLTLAGIFVMALENQRSNYISVHVKSTFETISMNFPSFHLSSPFVTMEKVNFDGINMVGVLGIENGLIIVLLTIAIAQMVRTMKQKPTLYFGIATQAIGFAMMGFSTSFWPLMVFGFIQTVGEMFYVPVRQSYQAAMMDENARGAYSAFNGLLFQVAKMIGAISITLSVYIGRFGMLILMLSFGVLGYILHEIAFKIYSKKKVLDID
ncbi:MAG: hypothetical protein K0R71_1917 [Bacillales bacterium]|jgi:DHA1 family multidrug resistance protein B-like MFS transporter|nr:hypothetical protein [Bacillales bacterium]